MTIIALGQSNIPVVIDVRTIDTSTNIPSDVVCQLKRSDGANCNPTVNGLGNVQFVIYQSTDNEIYDLLITSNDLGPGPATASLYITQNAQYLKQIDETGAKLDLPPKVTNLPTGVATTTAIAVHLQ